MKINCVCIVLIKNLIYGELNLAAGFHVIWQYPVCSGKVEGRRWSPSAIYCDTYLDCREKKLLLNTMDNNKMIAVRRIIFTLILLMKLNSLSGKFHHDTLNFSHKNLKNVPSDLLKDMNNTMGITEVSFSHNSISALKHSDFASFCNFPNLRYLFFDHNDIVKVEQDSFDCLPELVYLDLSNNKLSALPNKLCDSLSKLRHLLYVNVKYNPMNNFDFVTRFLKKGIEIDYNQNLEEKLLELNVIKNRKKRVLDLDPPLLTPNSTEEVDMDVSYANLTDFESHGNITLNDKYISSIVFNFFAASLVLVVIPLSMFIYYCVSKCERGS